MQAGILLVLTWTLWTRSQLGLGLVGEYQEITQGSTCQVVEVEG